MSAPQDRYACDAGVMLQAAENWERHREDRERKADLLRAGRYREAETAERLAKRVNHLLRKVRQTPTTIRTGMSRSLEALSHRPDFVPEEIDDATVERVIGETRDFLSVGFLEKGAEVSRCVGRIVTELGGGRRSFGTGFLVSPRLLLTNHHVLRTKADAGQSVVEFDFQVDGSGQPRRLARFALAPGGFFLNDQTLDYALVACAARSQDGRSLADYGFCPLIGQEGKIRLGEPINVIQHPKGETKQVVVRDNKLLDLLETVAHYEADTEPGSSGSPVFNDQWEVVALHHSGVPKRDGNGNILDVDGRPWQRNDDPARIAWVSNEGIRISRLVAHVAAARVEPHEEPLRRELLEHTSSESGADSEPKPPMAADARPRAPGVIRMNLERPDAEIAIPLEIRVRVDIVRRDSETAATRHRASGVAAIGLVEAVEPDPDYSNRPGYDPDFLGVAVPLPKLSNALRSRAVQVDADGGGDGFEIKYHHYSVIMNGTRRLAFVSAVNYNAGAPFKHEREQGRDRWFFDPRIEPSFQADNRFYEHNPLDRGHLTRRADAGWGDTPEQAKLANDDTFHWTNCSPQHEIFNQSTRADRRGLLLWGNIENHIAGQARGRQRKLSIFNGPRFRSNDPSHRGLKVPREYWKVVACRNDAGRLRAVGFVLSQDSLIRDLPEEEFTIGPYRPFQVRLRDLEAKTGLDFGALKSADPLEDDFDERSFEAGTDHIRINRLEEIVL